MNKQKISNKKFRRIVIPVISVIFSLCLIATVVMNVLSSTMDTFLGGADIKIEVPEDAKNWDSEYYKTDYKTSEEAKEASYEVSLKVQDEGTVLLKNNGILPLSKGSKVVPFGYRYNEPIFGQLASGGSAKWMVGNQIMPSDGLKNIFTVDNSAVDKTKNQKPNELKEAAGTRSASENNSALGGNSLLYEYDPAIYNGLKVEGSTALVFIARAGQEGYDLKADAYEDGTPHYLALTENEKGIISAAKRACEKVVLIIESSAIMELDPVMHGELEADAIVWYGHAGERGFAELGKILSGEVNPSGRTVDIFPKDFTKDPTYSNNGDYHYTNAKAMIYGLGSGEVDRSYVEYQEGVYMGYRYYETANELGVLDYENAVTFPFGYGLSYTSFTQTIKDFDDSGDCVKVTVNVKNEGVRKGKDVVQLYYTAPYTKFDVANKIEKPVAVLAAFGKTVEINANESKDITLEFNKEDMASYCYTHENPNGTNGCYVLESGDYVVSLRANSHVVLDSRTVTIGETIWYDGRDKEHIRQSEIEAQSTLDVNGNPIDRVANGQEYVSASNLFQDSTDYMLRQSSIVTRNDLSGSLNNLNTEKTKTADETTVSLFGIDNYFDWNTDPLLGNVKGSKVYSEIAPVSGAKNGKQLIDLRGKDYYDEEWDELLEQIDWSKNTKSIIDGLCACAYNSPQIEDVGLVSTIINDGVSGIKVQDIMSSGGYDMTKTATYGMMPLLASTWNVDLLEKVGEALGREGLANNVQGLYGPAINLHRSPFCGRIFEYFSEDPLLSGKLAAAEISGAGKMGLTCYFKHFALNDQEFNRSNLLSVWADEQTMRELYFKAFEIAVKEARCSINYISDNNGTISTKIIKACTGIMPTQANIGAVPGHANYALLTELLRGEWGFNGTVTTDYWVWAATGANAKKANTLRDASFRAGSDIYLCMGMPTISVNDKSSATALWVYRRNVKNLCYTVVNSAAMQGIVSGVKVSYGISPWKIGLIVANIVIDSATIGVILWIVLRTLDEKKNPKKYKQSKDKYGDKNAA